MKFKEQAERYLDRIQSRKRLPVKTRTARIYKSYLSAHILPLLGGVELTDIENGLAKSFIEELNERGLSGRTVNSIFNVVKAVLADATDSNGNQLYPRAWNNDFIDLPVVVDKDMPSIATEKLNAAVSSLSRQDQAMLVLLAASGLRIGELLSLNVLSSELKGSTSYWDPGKAVIYVKSTLSNGVLGSPKTKAGIREVDLYPAVNEYLKTASLPKNGILFPVSLKTAYKRLKQSGIDEGFHAFRRFRVTHLEGQQVPRSLIEFWVGHEGKTVTDSYIKIGKDLNLRKYWAEKAGIGFNL